MADVLMQLDGLRKAYGSLVVTDDVSLAVHAGELHAVIGPNGAGKTTLVHQMSGLLPSDAGRTTFAGGDITALGLAARARRGIARSFQITSVLPAFTARENVAIAAQALAGSSFRFFAPVAEEKALNDAAAQALERVGLSSRADVQAQNLSHGEKRQLEIAIAMALEPKLLLLDEPLAGLGPEDSRQLITLLAKLKNEFTIVLVEHDMDAVFALADRVSVLVYGRVIASGPPAVIRNDPAVREAYLGEEGG
ncbi:MAG: branched-chain amino acid transporter substrate-binding protein [Pseudomonadota bacterium]